MPVPPKVYLLSCIRNEGPFLLEFVAHHRVLGFDRIFIASNDCNDGSVRLLKALETAGYATHVANRVRPGKRPQHEGYRRIRMKHDIDAADWIMMLDADEFLNVHIGDNSVQALIAQASPEVDVIALNAATFGDSGHKRWQAGPVTRQFTRRLPIRHRANWSVKSLSRNPSHFGAIHNHSLVQYRGPKPFLVVMRGDGSCETVDLATPLWKQIRRVSPNRVRLDLAQYNHYAVKTIDAFRLRAARPLGTVPDEKPNTRHDDAYFNLRASADVPDMTISRYAQRLDALMAEMLSDSAIAEAQTNTERRYRMMLDTLD